MLPKPPGVGSAKGMHQDLPYWPIEPMELVSCWFALDDATPENGCISVLPGWHTRGALPHYTAPNTSRQWRRAIALSYMSARSRFTGEGEGPVYFPIQGQTFPGCVR